MIDAGTLNEMYLPYPMNELVFFLQKSYENLAVSPIQSPYNFTRVLKMNIYLTCSNFTSFQTSKYLKKKK